MPQLDFFIFYKMLYSGYVVFTFFHFFLIMMFINFLINFIFFDRWIIFYFKFVYFYFYFVTLIFKENFKKIFGKKLKIKKIL